MFWKLTVFLLVAPVVNAHNDTNLGFGLSKGVHDPLREEEQQSCVCKTLTIIQNIVGPETTPFLQTFMDKAASLFDDANVHRRYISNVSCSDFTKIVSERENKTLYLLISDTMTEDCHLPSEIVDSLAVVQLHPAFGTDPLHDPKPQWLLNSQSNSTEIHLLFEEDSPYMEMNSMMFVLTTTCSPTKYRNSYPGRYVKLNLSDVGHHYERTLTFSGPIIALGLILFLGVIWLVALFVLKKIRQEELKEQRELRLYIAGLDSEMDEREKKKHDENIAALLERLQCKSKRSLADMLLLKEPAR